MAKLLYTTKGSSSLKGKPRVYFTCHPDDFDGCFEKIKNDILRTHDCAIYYTEDMREALTEDNISVDLIQMNLFAVVVTRKLLEEQNRAMSVDIAFAKQEGIPILPFMMEDGIDDIYSKPEAFDKLQYLNPYSTDTTEIGYLQKLKRYLESVLIDDEVASRIRAAFDAYIFLSYRKKDRQYANQLMRIIHGNPRFRDIAIWYDEFLTPGESFEENIQKALNDSKLFTLLVTPSILEKNGGKPNFVMAEEYPAALRANKTILPAEMVKTNKKELVENFKDIPECVDPMDEEAFKTRFLQALKKIAISTNDRNPEHLFLIGLAYMDGIDVEVDRERGEKLIKSAAESGLFEAMMKLYSLYMAAPGGHNTRRAIKWGERMYEYCLENNGEGDINTARAGILLAKAYDRDYKYSKGEQHTKKAYETALELFGEEHSETLNFLQYTADYIKKPADVAKVYEKIYEIQKRTLGEEHEDTYATCVMLAKKYSEFKEGYSRSLKLYKELLLLSRRLHGEEHENTVKARQGVLRVIGIIDMSYWEYKPDDGGVGYKKKRIELYERECAWATDNLGSDNPYTVELLMISARSIFENGGSSWYQLFEAAYGIRKRIYGDVSDEAVSTWVEWAKYCAKAGMYDRAEEMFSAWYELCRTVYGENDAQLAPVLIACASQFKEANCFEKALPYYEKARTAVSETLAILLALPMDEQVEEAISIYKGALCDCLQGFTDIYMQEKKYSEAIQPCTELCELFGELLGDEHEYTVSALYKLARLHRLLGEYKTAAVMFDKVSRQFDRMPTFGNANKKNSITARDYLADCYERLEQFDKAATVYESVYDSRAKMFGVKADETFDTLLKAAKCYRKAELEDKGIEILEAYLQRNKTGRERTVGILKELAALYEKKQMYRKVAEIDERLYELYALLNGKNDSSTYIALHNSAYFYAMASDHEKAVELYEAVWSIKINTLGKENDSTYLTMANLALEYLRIGRYSEALELYQQVYAFRVVKFGADHPKTLVIAERIEEVKSKLHESDN